MKKIWFIIWGLIVITSCKKEDLCDTIVPGEVIIDVLDNETLSTIEALITNYELSIEYTISPDRNSYLIVVPEGEESYWIEKLSDESIIESTEHNYYLCID